MLDHYLLVIKRNCDSRIDFMTCVLMLSNYMFDFIFILQTLYLKFRRTFQTKGRWGITRLFDIGLEGIFSCRRCNAARATCFIPTNIEQYSLWVIRYRKDIIKEILLKISLRKQTPNNAYYHFKRWILVSITLF